MANSRIDKILTETWRDKRFEGDLTKLYFDVIKQVNRARRLPCLPYLRDAYTAAREFSEAMVYSKDHLKEYKNKVSPVLEDLQLILFGDPGKMEIVKKAAEYNVAFTRRNNQTAIVGGTLLANEISEIVFLIKQWGYDQGLFMPKPLERKFGTEAIEDVMNQ